MELQTRKVSDLIPYINNSRTHSEEQINQIISSIKEFGFTNPILLEEENGIIAGHGRLMAVKKMGWTEVPCVTIKGLTKTQIKALNIADNQIALNAGWDLEKLKLEIKGLDEDSFNLDILGFNKNQIDDFLFEEVVGLTDEEEVPEAPEEPITKLGDIWKLGKHKLICGDATNKDTVKLLMEDNKADLIFTDPPYNVNYSARTGIRSGKIRDNMSHIKNDNLSDEEFDNLLENSISNMFENLDNKASYYICNNWHCSDVFKKILQKLNINVKAWIVWNKDWMSVGHSEYRSNHEFIFFGTLDSKNRIFHNQGKENDVWTIRKLSPTNKIHTTEKPVALVERAIKNSSNNNQIVIDFFSGSGSTLIACEKNNRIFKGLELDPKYCDVIIQRWQNFTGKEAIHEQTGKRYNEL
jgi:DNA modification methylase